MEALKLIGMQVIKDLQTEEELDVLRDFLLTDPLKITHSIAFWKQELPNATEEEKGEITKLIASLKSILKAQVNVTARVYSLSTENVESVVETKTEVIEEKQETVKETKQQTINPSVASLHVVRDEVIPADENRILRTKYEALIKNLTMEELKSKVMPLINNPSTEAEAIEMATFLLSEGLYKGKKAKKMDQAFIDKFLKSCRPKEEAPAATTEQSSTAPEVTENVSTEEPAADEDLYAKYACYLGDNKTSLTGIKTEVKFLMSEGKVEEAIQIAAFLLGAGEYVDSKPERWSAQQIEDFIKAIKDDLKANPMDLGPKEEIKEESEVVAETPAAEEKPEFDTKISDFYVEVENKILVDKLDTTAIKQWIFDSIKTRKVECLDMFHNVESSTEELESMYTTFFNSFVNAKFQEKEVKSIDMTEEITKIIKIAIDNKEKLLTSVIQEAGKMYAKRGEAVAIKEVRDIVHRIAADKYPEFYAEMIKIVGEKNKLTIVQDKVDFPNKYPEIWETVKDAKSLDDVYTMARELEKNQSFLVVSEMIIHLISSGKISDKEGNLVNWDNAAIEMWINTMFTPAETVAETTEPEVTTTETVVETEPEVVEPTPTEQVIEPVVETEKLADEPLPTEEVASQEVTEETSTQEEATSSTEQESGTQENTSQSETVEEVASTSVTTVEEKSVEELNITYPSGITIPEEHNELKELYASKKEGFFDGFVKIINGLTTKGETRKEITHTIADALMKIANDKQNSQCFARNFKGINIDGLYKMINSKANALEILGWKVE